MIIPVLSCTALLKFQKLVHHKFRQDLSRYAPQGSLQKLRYFHTTALTGMTTLYILITSLSFTGCKFMSLFTGEENEFTR